MRACPANRSRPHFHGPATPEETAPPAIDITESLLDGADDGRMEGSAELTEEQMADLQAGLYYINIHTPENPDGEIRGQVVEGEAEMDGATPPWRARGAMEDDGTMDSEAETEDAATE